MKTRHTDELVEEQRREAKPATRGEAQARNPRRRRSAAIILNAIILILVAAVGVFGYAFYLRSTAPEEKPAGAGKIPPRIIQLDVLNGCGAQGVASRFTSYLRNHGFDVVEMKNYKVSNIPRTLVIDRVGDLASARRVAEALGISEKNIIQQLNTDYFVDVSVIIGGDYPSLHPSSE